MEKLFFYFIFIFLFQNSYSQNDSNFEIIDKWDELTKTDSIYITAIEKYIDKIDPYQKEKTIYIQGTDFLKRIPNKIKDYDIIKIHPTNKKKYFKKNKRLEVVRVFSLTLEKDLFFISFLSEWTWLKNNKLNKLPSDYLIKVYFKYKNETLVFEKASDNFSN